MRLHLLVLLFAVLTSTVGAQAAEPAAGGSRLITIGGDEQNLKSTKLRVEMACIGAWSGNVCQSSASVRSSIVFTGKGTGKRKYVLRIRGIVELARFDGGKANGHWYASGRSVDPGWNIFELMISSDPKQYFLNAGGPRGCTVIDYTQTVVASPGDTLKLQATDADGKQLRNVDKLGIPDLGSRSVDFNGQFVQIDIVK